MTNKNKVAIKKEYKEKEIALNGNRRLINLCKKEGLLTFHPRGEWNGYGYEKLPLEVKIRSIGEMRKFNRIKKEVEDKESTTKKKTDEEKTNAWCRRLVRLTDISLEKARRIANEKIEYKNKEIEVLEERQIENGYSIKREKLIRKKERENPLRYIKDTEHAKNIIKASERHNNTEYDNHLQELHEAEKWGEIEKGHAKEIARRRIKGTY